MADEFSDQAKEVVRKFVHKISHEGLHSLRLQYNELRSYVPPNFSHNASDANPTKCRYKDILCLDSTRVVLRWPRELPDDFVHANWVTHELFDNRFICSQAPLDATVNDFWRICWQEEVRQILMLCRCEEMGKAKCAQYWPMEVDEKKSLPFGLTITCQKVDRSDKNFIHTRLIMTYEDLTRKIDHRQWTTWPDKSVPQTPLAPFRLLQYTRKYSDQPSLIHCSAGVGRTGTMVVIEMLYKSLATAVMPDPVKLVQAIRAQRFLAVQTEDQYVYSLYSIIQFAFAKKMASKHDVKMFCKEYSNYVKMVQDCGGRAPPLNATKLPVECLHCKREPKEVQIEQKPGNNDVVVEPVSTTNFSVSPLQTQITPSSLSPARQVQSMPNWSCLEAIGVSHFSAAQSKPMESGKHDSLADAIPTTELSLGADRSMKCTKTEPIVHILNTPVEADNNKVKPPYPRAPAYTVTRSTKGGKEPAKIVYHRNPENRFVKAIAGPNNAPTMQIAVPKCQLGEFQRQLKIRAEEIERNKKKKEAEQQQQQTDKGTPRQPPKKDPEN